MIDHEEQRGNIYDDIRFQQVIVEEMGELLPAKLRAQCDLPRARSILEIGCGTGEWHIVRPDRKRTDQAGFLWIVLPPAGVGTTLVTTVVIYFIGWAYADDKEANKFYALLRQSS